MTVSLDDFKSSQQSLKSSTIMYLRQFRASALPDTHTQLLLQISTRVQLCTQMRLLPCYPMTAAVTMCDCVTRYIPINALTVTTESVWSVRNRCYLRHQPSQPFPPLRHLTTDTTIQHHHQQKNQSHTKPNNIKPKHYKTTKAKQITNNHLKSRKQSTKHHHGRTSTPSSTGPSTPSHHHGPTTGLQGPKQPVG